MDGMADHAGLTKDEAALLAVVPEDGSTIGNARAREALSWDEERYFPVRNALADKGMVIRGVGRGGSLRRVPAEVPTDTVTVTVSAVDAVNATPNTVEALIRQREDELYEPMATVLQGAWAKDRRWNLLDVEITARQGRRQTGGTWSRPDIVSVEIKTFEYVPGKFLEVVTYEVKPADAIDVQAVYEALAHRRSSTRAYVVLHVPPNSEAALVEAVENVRQAARMHGIGVVTVGKPSDYSTWDELEKADRFEPDAERLNAFIEQQLGDKLKRKIARALR